MPCRDDVDAILLSEEVALPADVRGGLGLIHAHRVVGHDAAVPVAVVPGVRVAQIGEEANAPGEQLKIQVVELAMAGDAAVVQRQRPLLPRRLAGLDQGPAVGIQEAVAEQNLRLRCGQRGLQLVFGVGLEQLAAVEAPVGGGAGPGDARVVEALKAVEVRRGDIRVVRRLAALGGLDVAAVADGGQERVEDLQVNVVVEQGLALRVAEQVGVPLLREAVGVTAADLLHEPVDADEVELDAAVVGALEAAPVA